MEFIATTIFYRDMVLRHLKKSENNTKNIPKFHNEKQIKILPDPVPKLPVIYLIHQRSILPLTSLPLYNVPTYIHNTRGSPHPYPINSFPI